MGRWEPNARGRLAQIALALFAEQGFEATTAAEIAAAAGLTERTFFRHFADKRDVLFYGGELLESLLTDVIAAAPTTESPMQVVRTALGTAAESMQSNPERVRTRDAVIATHPELRERELTKLAGLATAMTRALGERGVPEPTASLAAEAGVAAFKVAFARWVEGPAGTDLNAVLAGTHDDLAEVVRPRSAARTAVSGR